MTSLSRVFKHASIEGFLKWIIHFRWGFSIFYGFSIKPSILGVPHDYGNPRASFVELLGGWATPLKNDGVKVTWDDLLFPMSGKSCHVPNHQPVYQFYHIFSLGHLRERAQNWWLQLTGSISPQEMAVEMSTIKNQPFFDGIFHSKPSSYWGLPNQRPSVDHWNCAAKYE